ncbi:hypothetical protein D3C73_1275900 [compost metagenome]
MEKTEEQLKFLIDMYQKIIKDMPSEQDLITKSEIEHNWFKEEAYPPYVPLIAEINELEAVLLERQRLFLEKIIELRLRKGIAGRENKDYYVWLLFVAWKDAQTLIDKFIRLVLNSSLENKDKDEQLDFIRKLAADYKVKIEP